MITENAGDLVHGQSGGPGQVQGASVVRAIAGEHRDCNVSDIGLGHDGHMPVGCRSANVPIGAEEEWREVGIKVVTQDRVGRPGRTQMLFCRPVITGQG